MVKGEGPGRQAAEASPGASRNRAIWSGALVLFLVMGLVVFAVRRGNDVEELGVGDGPATGTDRSVDSPGSIVVLRADGRLVLLTPRDEPTSTVSTSTAPNTSAENSFPSTSGSGAGVEVRPDGSAGTTPGTIPLGTLMLPPVEVSYEETEVSRLPEGVDGLDLTVDANGDVIVSAMEGGVCSLWRGSLTSRGLTVDREGWAADLDGSRLTYLAGGGGCSPSGGATQVYVEAAAGAEVTIALANPVSSQVRHPVRWAPASDLVGVLDGGLRLVPVQAAVVEISEVSVSTTSLSVPDPPIDERDSPVLATEALDAFAFLDDDLVIGAGGGRSALYSTDPDVPPIEVVDAPPGAVALDVGLEAIAEIDQEGRNGAAAAEAEALWVTASGELVVTADLDLTSGVGELKPVLSSGVVDAAFVPAVAGQPGPIDSTTTTTQPTATTGSPTTVPPAPTTTIDLRVPAQLGGPNNYLGWGWDQSGQAPESYLLSVQGGCVPKQHGDRWLARADGEVTGCDGADNPEYRSTGYTFAIDVPAGHGAIDVALLLPESAIEDDRVGFNGAESDQRWECDGCEPTSTTFRLRAPSGAVVVTRTFGETTPERQLVEVSLATIEPLDAPGTYLLDVTTNSLGESSNSFGLAAVPVGRERGDRFCSVGVDPTCPRVYATNGLPLYVAIEGPEVLIPLALVPVDAGGGAVEIELFDPAEGATSLEILDGAGTAVVFDWSSPDRGGEGTDQVGIRGAEFNAQTLKIVIEDPAAQGAAGGWWSVRYSVADTATDRTTWNVYFAPPG